VCTYVTNTGKLEQVSSRGKVPSKYLRSAKCTTLKEDVVLAKPEEIDLEGAVRRVSMGSPLGSINMRWPKKIERLFGRTPERALADAARAVSRSLRSGSFPGIVKNMSPRWEVVFLDADLPEEQIPAYLIGACHPGWMTPPANIYIVGQRVAGGCAGGSASTKVADAQLAEVLIHEMGHAVEFELLRGNYSMDLVRAEGFATWFTQYAATYSSEIDVKSLKQRYLDMAQEALRRESNVGHFSGSSLDYARASMIFSAIVDRRGITGLMKVYNIMAAQRLPFFEAIQSGIGWNQRRLQEEVLRLVR
ncbi:MAG: hypothetical protein GX589_01535, partial [Deltaproteobacteria bacterium]|nr:hypothetical protein [Deltaproteobacteria bacterium]